MIMMIPKLISMILFTMTTVTIGALTSTRITPMIESMMNKLKTLIMNEELLIGIISTAALTIVLMIIIIDPIRELKKYKEEDEEDD